MTSLQDQFPNEVVDRDDDDAVSLPYAGTSGYSGSEASRERAERRDRGGETLTLQQRVARVAAALGPTGVTIAELRKTIYWEHHGSLSGALTVLHKSGRLLRLREQRGGCSIYVAPRFLLDREPVPPKRRTGEVLVTDDMNCREIGERVATALAEYDKVTVRARR